MLPIHEQFYTFQGEGAHAGRAAYFIRTFGCPVHCPWCDSAGTWHPDYIPKHIDRLEPAALAAEVADTRAEFTVITGGEPAIHDLSALTAALHAVGQQTHLETSGAFPIRGAFDWITLSPKRWKLPLADNVARANEYKLIIDRPEAIAEYVDALTERGAGLSADISSGCTPNGRSTTTQRCSTPSPNGSRPTAPPTAPAGSYTKTTPPIVWINAASPPPHSAVIRS